MKVIGLVVFVLILAFGALMMIDGIMAALGTGFIPTPFLTVLIGFVFVLSSGLFLNQVRMRKD